MCHAPIVLRSPGQIKQAVGMRQCIVGAWEPVRRRLREAHRRRTRVVGRRTRWARDLGHGVVPHTSARRRSTPPPAGGRGRALGRDVGGSARPGAQGRFARNRARAPGDRRRRSSACVVAGVPGAPAAILRGSQALSTSGDAGGAAAGVSVMPHPSAGRRRGARARGGAHGPRPHGVCRRVRGRGRRQSGGARARCGARRGRRPPLRVRRRRGGRPARARPGRAVPDRRRHRAHPRRRFQGAHQGPRRRRRARGPRVPAPRPRGVPAAHRLPRRRCARRRRARAQREDRDRGRRRRAGGVHPLPRRRPSGCRPGSPAYFAAGISAPAGACAALLLLALHLDPLRGLLEAVVDENGADEAGHPALRWRCPPSTPRRSGWGCRRPCSRARSRRCRRGRCCACSRASTCPSGAPCRSRGG